MLDRNKPHVNITISPVNLDIKSGDHIIMLHFVIIILHARDRNMPPYFDKIKVFVQQNNDLIDQWFVEWLLKSSFQESS